MNKNYEYIAKELRKQPVDSQFFMGLKLLCDAVEFQNARLIVDAGEESLCLAQVRRLGEELDATKGGGLQKKALTLQKRRIGIVGLKIMNSCFRI